MRAGRCLSWYTRASFGTYPHGVPHVQPNRLLAALSAAAGGLVTDTAFPDRGIWPMAFLGVALLVFAIRRDSARWAMLMGTLWGVGFFLPHLWWANYAVGPIPWVALALSQALITGAGMATWAWVRRGWPVRRRTLGAAVPFAIIWVLTEQLRQVWPFGGFPWGRLAFSQTDAPLVSLASIAGAPLVSGAVAATGFLLAMLALSAARVQIFRVAGAVVAAFVIIGGAALIPLPSQAESGTLRTGSVQGNVQTPGLDAFSQAREVLNNHVTGTEELVDEHGQDAFDVIFWPENSSDYNPRVDEQAHAAVQRALDATDVPLLMGTDRYGIGPDGEDARFNEMVLWMPGEGDTFAYAKQIPAAFAEYIPMRNVARVFSPAVDLVRTDMARGQETAAVPIPIERLEREVIVSTPICFEVAYDALIRESVRDGAELIVVPTNNASFGFTAESTQQLAMSQLRAVEHGRATIQISTVGVSGIITPNGVLVESTELFTPDQLAANVPLRTTLTIADRLGDWPIILTTVTGGVLLIAGLLTGRAKQRAGGRPARAGIAQARTR